MEYFNNAKLIEKHGSWMRVQVAFYDFLFESALNILPEEFREVAVAEAIAGGFADGEDLYERSITGIERHFESFDAAWQAFEQQEESDET